VTSTGNLSVAGKVSATGRAGQGGRIDLAGAKILVPGKITASGQKGGQIAVTSTGNLSVAGRVSAKGRTGEGGRIDLAGKDIALTGAKVNASGATAGGLVRVGGAFQGGKADQSDPLYQSYVARWGALPPIAAATTVTIDGGTRINVSARHAGDGGTAIVWSEQTTSFAGSILARGGALGGDGGSVETSGRVNLQATGIVDAAASKGAAGMWLLDPNNVTIQTAAGDTFITGCPSCTTTNDSAILSVSTIQTALNNGTSVTVTTGSAGTNLQAGDITVANAIAKTAGGNATLTLNASHDISFSAGADITSTTGALGLTLNAAGNINTLQNVSLNGGTLTLNATGNGTQSGVISGNTSVTMSGAGTFTLSSTNTYTGVTTINAGVLSVATIGNGGSAGNLGAATSAAGNLVLGGGTLQYTGATASTNRAFTLTAGTTSSIDVTTNTLTISGAGANTTGSLTKIGAGGLTLSGANAYTGATTVSAGTLTLGANNVLASASTVVVNGGTFSIANRTNTVAGVQLASGSITGTTGVLTSTTAYDVQSGTVSAILAGGVGLNKTTSGTVTLSGNNAYTGTTTISAGTLQVGSGGTTGSVAGDIVNNAALTVNRSNALTYAGVTSGTGSLTKSGAGTLTLTGGQHLHWWDDDQRRHAATGQCGHHRQRHWQHRQQRRAHLQPQQRADLCRRDQRHRRGHAEWRGHADAVGRQHLHGHHDDQRRDAAGRSDERLLIRECTHGRLRRIPGPVRLQSDHRLARWRRHGD
jgi:fibronectin-binding autotransporter adhesin